MMMQVQTRIWNPVDCIRWNSDKRYLLDLAAAGCAIVPTICLDRGQASNLAEVMAAQSWDNVIIKPRTSASAHGIVQVARADADQHQEPLEALLSTRGVLVQ
jgi:glutathione synthase/RimK-type ligase-like ATP-grasp enzyme